MLCNFFSCTQLLDATFLRISNVFPGKLTKNAENASQSLPQSEQPTQRGFCVVVSVNVDNDNHKAEDE